MRAEEIIKIIEEKGLQKEIFQLEEDYHIIDKAIDVSEDNEEEIEFEDTKSALEYLGLEDAVIVDSREDTSEFWAIAHFIESDVYIRITGEYDSYGQYEHHYNSKVREVRPKTVSTVIYE